jgi:hypothetical protein
MIHNDLDINRSVRKVMVKHWIDLGRIWVRCANGRVHIHGTLARITGVGEDLTPAIVSTMFDEIERLPGIKNIRVEIDNWIQSAGAWKLVGQKQTGPSEKGEKASADGVFDLRQDEKAH